jgi:hypothetical protein
MSYMASIVLPVLPGKAQRVKDFGTEVASHQAEWDRLCREAGQFRHYNVTLQESPMGDFCIYSMVLDDPAKARTGFGTSPYDRWWLSFVKDVHGVDLSGPNPPLPPSVYTWNAAA